MVPSVSIQMNPIQQTFVKHLPCVKYFGEKGILKVQLLAAKNSQMTNMKEY